MNGLEILWELCSLAVLSVSEVCGDSVVSKGEFIGSKALERGGQNKMCVALQEQSGTKFFAQANKVFSGIIFEISGVSALANLTTSSSKLSNG